MVSKRPAPIFKTAASGIQLATYDYRQDRALGPTESTGQDQTRSAESPQQSKPTLLVVHANGFCASAYDPMIEYLVNDFDVLSCDLRGHGRSSRPADDDFDWEQMGYDLDALIDELDTPIYGFGHSLGGACLLWNHMKNTENFKAMVLFEPVVFPEQEFAGLQGDANNIPAMIARQRRSTFASREAALWRYSSRAPLNRFSAGSLAGYMTDGLREREDGSFELACAPEDEARVYEQAVTTTAHVASVAIPITVISGASDPDFPGPAEMAAPLVQALPNATLLHRPHLDHFGPFAAPNEVAQITTSFLNSL